MKHNKKIKKLYLCDNDIGNLGLKYLGDMLKINNMIKGIFLFRNDYDDDGVKYLLKSIEYNKTITDIHISCDNNTCSIIYLDKILSINKV